MSTVDSSEQLRRFKKIEKMCQAYFRAKPLLPQNPIKINEDEVEIIPKVVTGLIYATSYSINAGRKYIQIAWPFLVSKENYDRYIAPWHEGLILQCYAFIGVRYRFDDFVEAEQKFEAYANNLSSEMRFFCITTGAERWGLKLSEASFDRV